MVFNAWFEVRDKSKHASHAPLDAITSAKGFLEASLKGVKEIVGDDAVGGIWLVSSKYPFTFGDLAYDRPYRSAE